MPMKNKRKTVKMKKKILWYLASIFIIFLILFTVLKIGLKFDSIQTHFFAVEQLYIKLDKKLTIRAQKIELFNQEEVESFELKELANFIENLKYIYLFFQEIHIQSLHANTHTVTLSLKDEDLSIENELLSTSFHLRRQDNNISADIKELFLKGIEAKISGKINIDTQKETYNINLSSNSTKLKFELVLSYDAKSLNFIIKETQIANLRQIFEFLDKHSKLGKNLIKWVGTRAVAQFYHLDYVRARLDLGKKTVVKELVGEGFARNLTVLLDENITSIEFPYVEFKLNNDRLDFIFDEASFDDKELDQSELYIYDLLKAKQTGIFMNIKSNELILDQKMQDLLRLYKINIPFTQLSGKLKSDFYMKLPFFDKTKLDYNASFELNDSKFITANLFVPRGKIRLERGKLFFDNFELKNDFLEASFKASLDLNKKNGVFDTQLSRLYFKDLLDLPRQRLELDLSYDKDVILNARSLDLSLNFTKGLSFSLLNAKKFKEHSKLMQDFKIQNIERLSFSTQDFNDYLVLLNKTSFEEDLLKSDLSIYEDDFTVKKRGDLLDLSSKSGLINVNMNKNKIKARLKDLYCKLDPSAANKKQEYELDLKASNAGVLLTKLDKSLHFDKLDLKIKERDISLQASKKQATFKLLRNKNEFLVDINGADEGIVNDFFRKDLVKNGQFNLHIKGASEDDFTGNISFNDTYIKDMKIHNQLISFIDTVPSLILFKSPTFNEQGLKVKKAGIVFERMKDKIHIRALGLNGDSVDVIGSGAVDLNKDIIDMKLELQTLKSASQIIANIPIINQIILGKDKIISTQILVSGKIAEPKFSSQLIKESLKLPINLLKNIIELPATMFK